MPRVPRPTAFQPLLDYLADTPADELTLTFREIAAMIGRPLPEMAILHNNWWTNTRRPPIAAWQALGWEARADRDHLRVTFTRVHEE